MKKYKVGFIGFGNMAQAIVSSLVLPLNKHILKQYDSKIAIAVSDPDAAKLESAPKKVLTTTDNAALVNYCDVIVLAIKPQTAKFALEGLDFSGKIVVSIMASVTIDAIKQITGNATDKIARIMPNMNAKIGMAYSAYCFNGLSEDEQSLVRGIVASIGNGCEVQEKDMNISTAICGSGPAFVFKFIESMANAGIENGLSSELAFEMAIYTVIGSAALIEKESFADDFSVAELVKSICSKGGTTIAGVNYLDENSFDSTVRGAIERARARAEEMSKENENR